MQKICIIILMLVIFISLSANMIQHEYYFNEYQIEKITESPYQTINFKKCKLNGLLGEPVLPYRAVKILIPPGHIVTDVNIKGKDIQNIEESLILYPSQGVKPISSGTYTNFQKNKKLYKQNILYPDKMNKHFSTEYWHGYSILLTTFTPVQYNPLESQISYFSKVEITINTRHSSEAQAALQNLKKSESLQIGIKKFIDNPAQINQYHASDNRNDSYHHLLITNEDFSIELIPLKEFYLNKGLDTRIVTVEEISYEQPGDDLQEKIRNYIIQEYQNHDIIYTTLAGDVEIIPYRGFYCQVQSSQIYEDESIPSDLYYSALDGNWNNDNDNLWGEIGEEDLLPEIAVARLPFSDNSELANMLNKIIEYQQNPVLNELRNPLLVGEHLCDDPLTYGGDYMDLLIGYQNANGYETTGIPENDNYVKLYDRDMGTWNQNQLLNEINAGKSFIHHSGHSNQDYNMRLYSSDIYDSNFSEVNGSTHNFTAIYSHGCLSASFDVNSCIAEKMLSIQNFTHSYVGNSRYGWFNEGQTEGPSHHLHREFIDALYEQKIANIGNTHLQSRINTAPWVNAPGQHEQGALRWCFYDCNVLGDAALSIWTDEPIDYDINYSNSINVSASSYEVYISENGTPLNNYRCSLIKDGQIYGSALTNSAGIAIIEGDPIFSEPGQANLIVSGYNSLTQSYPITVNLQNQPYIIISDYYINAGEDNIIEFGETVNLDLTFENIGTAPATDIDFEVSDSCNFIELIDNINNIGNLEAEETITIENAIQFTVNNNVPDNYEFHLNISLNTNSNNWDNSINLTAFAPILLIEGIQIEDNDNGQLDAGDIADVMVTIINAGGAKVEDVMATIACDDENLNINDNNDELAIIESGATGTLTFNVEVDEQTEIGHVFDFLLNITAANEYSSEENFSLNVGLIIEDFETGDFGAFPWEFFGDQDWMIASDTYEGDYSAQSSDINDNQTSELSITMSVSAADVITFYKKVSSESYYDYFRFFIDDEQQAEWSGEVDWSEESFDVSEGIHTFKWVYEKDYTVSSGSDCAWLDYIIFPPAIIHTVADLEFSDDAFEVDLELNSTTTEHLEITNTGDLPADYNIGLINTDEKDRTKDLTGSSVECSTNEFWPGETVTWTFTVSCVIDDNEWIKDVWIEFPSGVNVLSSTDLEDDIPTDGATGDGATVHWGGSGYMADGEQATAEVEVSISAGYLGDMVLPWIIHGDEWGSPPHEITGEIELTSIGEPITWLSVSPTSGTFEGNSTETIELSFDTADLEDNTTYICQLRVVDSREETLIPVTLNVGEVSSPGMLPAVTELKGNYPNPFNPETTIHYSLKEASPVSIKIYNIKGQCVRTLINAFEEAGYHTAIWQGKDDNNKSVTSGVYFYRLKSNGYTSTKKMLLLK